MWFLHKETGLKWEVTDEALMRRLMENESYDLIESPIVSATTAKKSKSNGKLVKE
ncbi:hypothetical protein [Aneurinibacillus aneurinilyticus]|jgi:hypothetical protein|uniref:hypothetical protein n=1 Tax=Aneurinibacillus aneurinilyticus TaxID=1391 RepID=UPI0023F70A38|nr:hypothetical protein [Aneurinibacillus aneurinilyticus]MCI1693306.1 hypothetical protein [Aneurinibacillus aneurinilyticus]